MYGLTYVLSYYIFPSKIDIDVCIYLQIQGGAKKEKKNHIIEKTQKIKQKYKGMFKTIRVIAQEEGVKGLYKGIVPGLQRQMCFAPVRVGCYDEVKRIYMRLLSKGNYIFTGFSQRLCFLYFNFKLN